MELERVLLRWLGPCSTPHGLLLLVAVAAAAIPHERRRVVGTSQLHAELPMQRTPSDNDMATRPAHTSP